MLRLERGVEAELKGNTPAPLVTDLQRPVLVAAWTCWVGGLLIRWSNKETMAVTSVAGRLFHRLQIERKAVSEETLSLSHSEKRNRQRGPETSFRAARCCYFNLVALPSCVFKVILATQVAFIHISPVRVSRVVSLTARSLRNLWASIVIAVEFSVYVKVIGFPHFCKTKCVRTLRIHQ